MSNGFDDWVEGKTGWEWLDTMFKDPYAEAKAFYGPEVFARLFEQEKAQRDWELVKRKASESRRLIDDVAGQLHSP